MPLNGDLTDLSLAELLEFFCNQRKNGRLDVICPHGSGHFYVDSGAIVHGQIGQLSGIEAVYYALALPNATFSFSTGVQSPEETISQSWQSVVLEGLRLMEEGATPATTFPTNTIQADQELLEIEACEEEKVCVGLPEWVYEEIEKIRLEKRHSAFDEYVHAPAFVDESDSPENALAELADDSGEASERRAAPEMFAENIAEQMSAAPAEDETVHDPDSLIVTLREMVDKKEKPPPPERPLAVPSFLLEDDMARSSYSPWKLATLLTAIIVLLVAIAVPWGRYARSKAAKAAAPESTQTPAQPSQEANPATPANDGNSANPQTEPAAKAEGPQPQTEADKSRPN